MKKTLLLLLVVCSITTAFAQYRDDVYYIYKADWSNANTMKDAEYFMHPVKENDTTYVCRYYKKFGEMVKQESYRDESLTKPGGLFAYYTGGLMDSCGEILNGRHIGEWCYYNAAKLVTEKVYTDTGIVKKTDYITNKVYYADGRQINVSDDMDNIGYIDTTKQHILIHASYPGGAKGWVKYLTKSLYVPKRFSGIFKTECEVIVLFTIDKEGNVVDEHLAKSCEFSADTAAIELVKKGGQWQPASIDGRKVLYRQKQPIHFVP